MLLKRNLLESLTLICCSGSFFCILLNYVTNISPLPGIWFPIYTLLVFFVSLWFSFKLLHYVLSLNKPLKYDLEELVKRYPYLEFLKEILPKIPKHEKRHRISESYQDYDTNELSVISTVLERKLVSSWYVPYVSQEIGFPFACKQMLDQMIGKAFQICNKIETKEVFIDTCSVFIIHLREYKKALKRQENMPSSPIEALYKKAHVISGDGKTKNQSAEHCVHILRLVFKELIPWELWDTPHSELLIRILAKKLDTFIDSTIADPSWLSDKLISLLNVEKKDNTEVKMASEKDDIGEDLKKEDTGFKVDNLYSVAENGINNGIQEEIFSNTIGTALSAVITNTTAPIIQKALTEELKEDLSKEFEDDMVVLGKNGSDPLDIQQSPVMRQRRGRQGRNEVKIYDRIIEGSVKTWDTAMDLQCISVGQDLLASLDEMALSRLWAAEGDGDGSPSAQRRNTPQPLWFGEEESLEGDQTEPQSSQHKDSHSPKPTEVLLKDIQSTVNQAKSKIGDLQDEAAGMMEGLLDFGIAGLKKGLRFTGLGDDTQQEKDKSSPSKEKPNSSHSPPAEGKAKPLQIAPEEEVTSSLLMKDDIATNGVPPLVKQHRVTSQDSMLSVRPLESPEPQYEEAADLSSSIAKLRTLLQQRADDNSGGVWWEAAEETRGRTSTNNSRHVDSADMADEYDMSLEHNSPPEQTFNNMQRLDKLFHRTVTGVFNSLRGGAEGGEGSGGGGGGGRSDWTYVCTSVEMSVCGAVARLVGSRRAFTHVDAALDSLDQIQRPEVSLDPGDDLEECPCPCWSSSRDLLSAGGLAHSHAATQIAATLMADLSEELIVCWLDELSIWLRREIFKTFAQMEQTPQSAQTDQRAPFHREDTCRAIMEKMPAPMYLFGEETLSSAVNLTVSSLSHKELNKDVVFRLLDHMVLHFKTSAGLRNPSFDN